MWKASAPSNIAIVKYMGKESSGRNEAVNPSLSMTLSAFRTDVEITASAGAADSWAPLPGASPLRESSTKKFMDFFGRLKTEAEVTGSFLVRSGNNFPSDAGLASSASSFAALTKAATLAFSEKTGRPLPAPEALARISRTGSGSSCRSFFSPWCAWEGNTISPVASKLPALVDLVVVLDEGFKKVSSSEAHQRVRTSPLFAGRAERAVKRQTLAKAALASGNFQALAEVSWADLWDMHSLFHTSEPPFFYFAPETLAVLRWTENFWEKHGRGPIATIDAGPNVHLLVPAEEAEEFRRELRFPGTRLMESPA